MQNLQVHQFAMPCLNVGVFCAGLLSTWWNILNCTSWAVSINTQGRTGGKIGLQADSVHAPAGATASAVCCVSGELPFCLIDNVLDGKLWLFSPSTEEGKGNQQSCCLWSAQSVHQLSRARVSMALCSSCRWYYCTLIKATLQKLHIDSDFLVSFCSLHPTVLSVGLCCTIWHEYFHSHLLPRKPRDTIYLSHYIILWKCLHQQISIRMLFNIDYYYSVILQLSIV